MNLDTQLKIEMLYNQQKKSAIVAYLIGFIGGTLGLHYFYLGKVEYGAVIILLLMVCMIGGLFFPFIWFIYYAAVLFGVIHTAIVVEDVNNELKNNLQVMWGGVDE